MCSIDFYWGFADVRLTNVLEKCAILLFIPNYVGMCEVVWEKDMSPEQLFENISQALLNAQDRDCLAGWGATVHVM